MPFKNSEAMRAYQRSYKAEERAERRQARSLHRELGIKTYTHMQAILHSPFDGRLGRGVRNQQVNAHWYRVPITLPKVFI